MLIVMKKHVNKCKVVAHWCGFFCSGGLLHRGIHFFFSFFLFWVVGQRVNLIITWIIIHNNYTLTHWPALLPLYLVWINTLSGLLLQWGRCKMTVCVLGADSHPDTFLLWLANMIIVISLLHPLFTDSGLCSKRILMSLKIHTQLYSSLGSLKVWFVLPHDTLHLFRKCTQDIFCSVHFNWLEMYAITSNRHILYSWLVSTRLTFVYGGK